MQDPKPAFWIPTGSASFEDLSQTRQEMHMGALVLGSVAHALLEHRDDDSHANLGVDIARGSLCTHPIKDNVKLHLELAPQRFVWRDGDEQRGKLAMVGKTMAQVFEELAGFASELVQRDVSITKREFSDFPDHRVLEGADFESRPEAELHELMAWFANGQLLFEGLAAKENQLSPIRTWPHHFDLGCLLPFTQDPQGPMVGLGMSPGDENYDQPYFYASPYPAPAADAVPQANQGAWHTKGFISQILTAKEIRANTDPEGLVRAYLEEALAATRKLAMA